MSEQGLWRMRVVYSVGDAVKYISHLDLLRAWERALRRAGVPLAYSHGYNPHPRVVIAMPLPVGCTGEHEVIDLYLYAPVAPAALLRALEPAMPPGIVARRAEEAALGAPALPSVISHALYEVTLADVRAEDARHAADVLVQRGACEVTFRRKTFDLRPLIGALDVVEGGEAVVLRAKLLRLASGRIGRPDVLLEALGLAAQARRVHRAEIAFGMAQDG